MTKDWDYKLIVRAPMRTTGESYAAARAQLTKPADGEAFWSGTASDGTPVLGLFTKLQRPEKGWSGLAVPSAMLGVRGRAWLRGTLKDHEFWLAAQPMGDGNHWVTINRAMRATMGLQGDEEVNVRFVVVDGPPPVELPGDVAAALRDNSHAAALFEGMSHSHRKEYLTWIAEAKRPETRARRIAGMLERILAAQGREEQ